MRAVTWTLAFIAGITIWAAILYITAYAILEWFV